MCPDKHLLESFNESEGGKVLMGNNVVLPVVGTGSVRLKLNDDFIRTLTNVRYNPDSKRNLISLVLLDYNGYSYKSDK